MTDQVEQLRAEIETLRADLISRKGHQAASDERATKAESALAAYEAELEAKRTNTQAFVTETLARLEVEAKSIAASLAEKRVEIERLDARIAELTPERDKLEKEVTTLKATFKEQHEALEKLFTREAAAVPA